MKKYLVLFLAVVTLLCVGCKKDDEPDFNYNLEQIYGKWRITALLQEDGSWFNVTSSFAEKYFEPTYATFYENGKYYGSGFFGDGWGTWKAKGNTLYTYVDGDEYLQYEIVSLEGINAHLIIREEGSSSTIEIKCVKQ